MKKLAVIGCGPAGLLAAHAGALAGYEPTIFSKEVKMSPNAKATYLHRSIPDVSSAKPDDAIFFAKVGKESVYAKKVYGDIHRATSWEKFDEGHQPAWALAPVYETLWRLYRDVIIRHDADYHSARILVEDYELVVNTAPATALCAQVGSGRTIHRFDARPLWIEEGAPPPVTRNMMIYNGSTAYGWCRSSDIFGVRSTEYGTTRAEYTPSGPPNGIKVTGTDCNCHPEIVRAGRWGTWKPGVLVHHAFEEVENAVLQLL